MCLRRIKIIPYLLSNIVLGIIPCAAMGEAIAGEDAFDGADGG